MDLDLIGVAVPTKDLGGSCCNVPPGNGTVVGTRVHLATARVSGEGRNELVVPLDNLGGFIRVLPIKIVDITVQTNADKVFPMPQAAELLQADVFATLAKVKGAMDPQKG